MRTLLNKAHVALLVVPLAFAAISTPGQGEQQKPLDPVWVENDIKGVKFVLGLAPIERHGIREVEELFKKFPNKYTSWTDETVLGFGGRRVKLSMGIGYTTVYVDYLLFNNQIVHYKLGADVSYGNWDRHGPIVVKAWREASGPEFKIDDGELTFTKDFPEVWRLYRSEIATHLGAPKTLNIPASLAKQYELLTDRFENSSISVAACDDGKPAIDALEEAKRVDMIENVLRSYNPGGRVYAAISLLRMQRNGRRLSPATKRAIKAVSDSEAEVSTCWGHTGIKGLSARDVIPEYVSSDEWSILRR